MHGPAKNGLHLVAVFVVALIFQQSLWCYHTPVGGCVRRDSFVGLLTPVLPSPTNIKKPPPEGRGFCNLLNSFYPSGVPSSSVQIFHPGQMTEMDFFYGTLYLALIAFQQQQIFDQDN